MTRDLFVGLLFLGAVLLVGVFTLMVRGLPASAANYRLSVEFKDIAGLNKGDAVRVRGYKNGEIENIDFTEERVLVTLRLFSEIEPKSGYAFEVLPTSPLGGTYLKYSPGSGTAVDTDQLVGRAGADLFGTVSEILNENREDIRKSISSLENILEAIDSGNGVISALFRDTTLRDDFAQTLSDTKEVTHRILESEGLLGALVSDTQMRDDIEQSITGIRVTIDKISSGEGPVGALVHDERLKEQIEQIFQRTDQFTEDIQNSRGLIGALLRDEQLKQSFQTFARDASNLVDEVRRGDGLLSSLINSSQLRDDILGTASDLSSVMERVRSGPGTVYSLIHDQVLYERATEAVALLRDATEDAREQAPISTFFGILFAPF